MRAIVGPNVVVGATFDPHSHLSARRIEFADLITVFKEFPHTDFVEVAEDLVTLVEQMATLRIVPKISVFDCRMIEVLPTSREPMRGYVDRIKALEQEAGILSVSVIHGFMAGDVPDLGTKVLVISDDAQARGDALAQQLGMELYALRGTTRPDFLSPKVALDRALALSDGLVVVADVWDNPGGGVPGDSTIILRELLVRNSQSVALASIWDPIAVRTCISAGIDAKLRLRFGAKMSAVAGDPIDADVIVRNVVRNAVQSFGTSVVPLGDSVLD